MLWSEEEQRRAVQFAWRRAPLVIRTHRGRWSALRGLAALSLVVFILWIIAAR